jgi:hypothetical protein
MVADALTNGLGGVTLGEFGKEIGLTPMDYVWNCADIGHGM